MPGVSGITPYLDRMLDGIGHSSPSTNILLLFFLNGQTTLLLHATLIPGQDALHEPGALMYGVTVLALAHRVRSLSRKFFQQRSSYPIKFALTSRECDVPSNRWQIIFALRYSKVSVDICFA